MGEVRDRVEGNGVYDSCVHTGIPVTSVSYICSKVSGFEKLSQAWKNFISYSITYIVTSFHVGLASYPVNNQ